jgi:hypothetical protein
MRELFQLLSPDEALDLCGWDPVLLSPDDPKDDDDRLRRLIQHLAGQLTYETEIRRSIAAGHRYRAVELAARAQEKQSLPGDLEGVVRGVWATLRDEQSTLRSAVVETLDEIKEATNDYADYRNLVLAELHEVTVVSDFPASQKIVAAALRAERDLERILGDSQKLVAEYRDESDKRSRRVAEVAIRAFASALDRYRLEGTSANEAVLRLIPDLVVRSREEVLNSIVSGTLAPQEIQMLELVDVSRPSADSHRRFASTAVQRLRLSVVSARLIDGAAVGRHVLGNAEDFARLERTMQLGLTYAESSQVWLSAAKTAAPETSLHLAAVGRGLLAWGRDYLDRDRIRYAGDLFKDAFTCLAEADRELPGPQIEEALKGLLVSKLWPAYSSVEAPREGGLRRDQWLDSVGVPLKWVKQTHNLQRLAILWADLDTIVAAELFFEIVAKHLGLPGELAQECATEAVSTYRLVSRPRMTLLQLKILLLNAGAPEELGVLLDDTGQVLEEVGRRRVTGDLYRQLQNNSESLRKQLDIWPGRRLKGFDEATDRLLGQLGGLLHRTTGEVRPIQISVRPLVSALFPRERSEEVVLPLLVQNSEDGAALTDVAVQVDVDPALRQYIRFDPGYQDGHTIGSMEPGAEEQVNFIVDLGDGLVDKVTDFKLDVLLRSEKFQNPERGIRKKFSIAVRPLDRSSRRNPYPTGVAVEPEHFIGREKELRILSDALVGGRHDSVPVVVGIRRIGKTSLLKKLRADPEIDRRFYSVYASVEDRPDADTSAHLLTYFATKIRDTLPDRIGQRVPFAREDFRQDPFAAFEQFIDGIGALELQKRVLLIVDEFDRILELIRKGRTIQVGGRVDAQVLGSLRKALMTNGALRVVFAGLPGILETSYDDRLFGLLLPVRVEPFSDKEGESVLEAANGVLNLTTRAREHLFRETGLQPYLLNLTCYYLFAHTIESGRDQSTLTDVQQVIQTRILRSENYFMDYLALLGSDAVLLRAVAAAERRSRTRMFVSSAEVYRELRKSGDAIPLDEVTQRLGSLCQKERPLLRSHGERYQTVIGMLGSYLLERQSI